MFQPGLFKNSAFPNRIELFPDFLTEFEERELIGHFESIKWQKVEMHGIVAKRRVAHYGLDYTYTKRAVKKGAPPPPWMRGLTAKAAQILRRAPEDFQEILITFYPVGSGIGWHKDAEVFGDAIVGVSLLSDCTLKFRKSLTADVIKLEIPRRSAYVFADEARWNWQHSITKHREERYSVTFRTLASSQP